MDTRTAQDGIRGFRIGNAFQGRIAFSSSQLLACFSYWLRAKAMTSPDCRNQCRLEFSGPLAREQSSTCL